MGASKIEETCPLTQKNLTRERQGSLTIYSGFYFPQNLHLFYSKKLPFTPNHPLTCLLIFANLSKFFVRIRRQVIT